MTQRAAYDRIAPCYDLLLAPVECLRFSRWRARLRGRILGKQVLEAGVGTGLNFPFYPRGVKATAIDVSPKMLDRAERRAEKLGIEVDIRLMDVQDLAFPDRTFDTVFATFVFCSVPDPVAGLREMLRVCRPGGRLLLLEHMRPGSRLGRIFDRLNPITSRLMGEEINRRTVQSVAEAGWRITGEDHLSLDIVRWIEARPEFRLEL